MRKIATSLLLLLIALGIQAASKNGHFFKVLKNENVSVENVEQRVADAWDAVGVYDDQIPPMLDGIAAKEAGKQQPPAVYDLMGRKVETPSKGIYIKNGKKYVVK